MAHRAFRRGIMHKPSAATGLATLPGYAVDLNVPAMTGLANNDPMPQIDDTTGNAHHATQATGGSQGLYKTGVLNGLPGCLLDGTDDFYTLGNLSAVFPTAGTLYVVAQLVSESVYAILSTFDVLDAYWRYSDGNGYMGVWRNPRVESYPASPFMPTTGAHIFTVRSSSAGFEVWLDGASAGAQSAAYHAGSTYTLGRGNSGAGNAKCVNGYLFRTLMYSAAHDSTAMSAAWAELQGIYGL